MGEFHETIFGSHLLLRTECVAGPDSHPSGWLWSRWREALDRRKQRVLHDPFTPALQREVPTVAASVARRRATREHHRAPTARRVRTRQHPTQPVVVGSGDPPLAVIEERADVGELRWADDRFPTGDVEHGLPDDGGRTEQATETGGGEPHVIGTLIEGLPVQQLMDEAAKVLSFARYQHEPPAIESVAVGGPLSTPQPTLGPVACSTLDAAARVVGGLLCYSNKYAGMQLAVMRREIDVPLSGDDACELYFVRSIDDALQLAWLAKQPVKVVRDHGVRLSKLAEHLLERRPTHVLLVGGQVIVLEPSDGMPFPVFASGNGFHILTLARHPST